MSYHYHFIYNKLLLSHMYACTRCEVHMNKVKNAENHCLLGFVVLSLGFRCIVSWVSLYCILGFVVFYLGFRWSCRGGGGGREMWNLQTSAVELFSMWPIQRRQREWFSLLDLLPWIQYAHHLLLPSLPPSYIFFTTDCVVSDCNRSWTINALISCCDGFC